MSPTPPDTDEAALRQAIESEPESWEARRRLAHVLYDRQAYEEAACVVWQAQPIPSTDIDLAFAARVLSKAKPRWAIRLLTAVLEQNQGKAVQNLGMANALLHHGMVLQAARFYGAALAVDPTLANPDLEHFLLWVDDEKTLWGDFTNRRVPLGDLPWMIRDAGEAKRLQAQMSGHTTPVHLPKLPESPGEALRNPLYRQEAAHGGKITPPPAVTIPIDRVDPKHRRYDGTYGADTSLPVEMEPAPVAHRPPLPSLSKAVYRPPMPAPASSSEESSETTPHRTAVMPLQFPPPATPHRKDHDAMAQSTDNPAEEIPVTPAIRKLVIQGLNRE